MRKLLQRIVLPLAMVIAVGPLALHFAGAQAVKDKAKDKDKVKDKDPKAVPTFELYKDSGDKFRFRLKDEEGVILAIASKGYETKADCQKVIDAIKRDAAKAKVNDQAK